MRAKKGPRWPFPQGLKIEQQAQKLQRRIDPGVKERTAGMRANRKRVQTRQRDLFKKAGDGA